MLSDRTKTLFDRWTVMLGSNYDWVKLLVGRCYKTTIHVLGLV
ncbi:hypothetical protein Hanom_Chr10g00918491 [Helianthus anomalus]